MSGRLTTDVDKRLLRTTKFPPEFNVKVDMTKVNIPVIKKWVSDEIARILGSDDDVVTDTIFNLIEGPKYVSTSLAILWYGLRADMLDSPTSRSCRYR
jgi:serine/arginine repetitive matrix protein 1